jgi:hypothetical protein
MCLVFYEIWRGITCMWYFCGKLPAHGTCRCNKNELIALLVEFGNCFIKACNDTFKLHSVLQMRQGYYCCRIRLHFEEPQKLLSIAYCITQHTARQESNFNLNGHQICNFRIFLIKLTGSDSLHFRPPLRSVVLDCIVTLGITWMRYIGVITLMLLSSVV